MFRILKVLLAILAVLVAAFAISWLIYMPKANERGVWINPANGSILRINMLRAELYNQTARGCLYDLGFPAHMGLVKAMEGAYIQADGDRLQLFLTSNFGPQSFYHADELPASCSAEPDPSPHNVFETMWAGMNENYAFFDLHGIDWEARHSLSPAPDEQMSDEALAKLIMKALEGLDDGHIQLLAGDVGFFSPSFSPTWMPDPELSRADLTQIARDNVGVTLTKSEKAPIEYGVREDGIGYILIKGMWANERFGEHSVRASERAFAPIAEAMKDAKAIIIDIRYNPGGNDGTAFAYAGHFSPETRNVFYKRTKFGDDWADKSIAVVTPAPDNVQLRRPVLVLTSDLTGSGAEIFTMSMMDLPQVKLMGEPTDGGLSDIHGIPLPNGWSLGLSNQEYRTLDDVLFEKVGVPVDISVPIDADELLAGNDNVLKAAIEHFQ